jgi:hypothetical protein
VLADFYGREVTTNTSQPLAFLMDQEAWARLTDTALLFRRLRHRSAAAATGHYLCHREEALKLSFSQSDQQRGPRSITLNPISVRVRWFHGCLRLGPKMCSTPRRCTHQFIAVPDGGTHPE